MHQHCHEITLGLSFALGALHALEPGHGKTAMLVYLSSGKRSLWHPVAMGISTAISHSVSLLAIAFAVHVAHHCLDADHHHEGAVSAWLQWISGIMIIAIGLWMLRQAVRGTAQSCCGHNAKQAKDSSCRNHSSAIQSNEPAQLYSLTVSSSAALSTMEQDKAMPTNPHLLAINPQAPATSATSINQVQLISAEPDIQQPTENTRQGYATTILLGIAIGLLPCPSAMAAYFTGLSSGSPVQAYWVIFLFGLGIACSLTAVGTALRFCGGHLANFFSNSRINWGVARASVILLVGIFYTARIAF